MTAENGNTKPAAESQTAMPDGSDGWKLAERCAWHLLEKKAEDLVVLDMRGRSDVCDFFVIASGLSDVQVQAAARHARDELARAGHKATGAEGLTDGRWALLDYVDVVVHVFHAKAREHFQLERLWGDAPRLDLDPAWYAAPEVAERHPDLNFTSVAGDGNA